MFSIIGIVVVFGAVLGGFLMEKGPMAVLMQPAEMVIILRRGHWDAAGCQSDACVEADCQRCDPRDWRVEVLQGRATSTRSR